MHPRRYETLIMLAPNLDAEKIETFKNKIDGIMSEAKGQMVRFEDWGRRRLSYPVQKEMYGYYLLYDFQGSPALAAEIERNLRIDENVFKYLTLVLHKNFTDECLAAEKERLISEAARREAEKNRPRTENEDEADDDGLDADEVDGTVDEDDEE